MLAFISCKGGSGATFLATNLGYALATLKNKPRVMLAMTLLIRLLVLLGCSLIAWGAWQQVMVGLSSYSVVLGYPVALLPLPAFLCSVAIGVMALLELIKRTPLDLGHGAEVE